MADEIHALNKNEIQDIDYDTYFGEMDLSDEERELIFLSRLRLEIHL